MKSMSRVSQVLMILPPDFAAPPYVRTQRFPPLGPAIVAATIAPLGFSTRAVDLLLEPTMEPSEEERDALDDPEAVASYLAGGRCDAIDAVIERTLVVLDAYDIAGSDFVALSVDRGSQHAFAAVLSIAIKRRWNKRILLGGVAMPSLAALLERTGAKGADVVTSASTPQQIAMVFEAARAMPEHREGAPIEPITEQTVFIRKGLRKAPPMQDWPVPDFGIYDLARYRRDPLSAATAGDPSYRDRVGERLILPYFFALECQFSCSFCQTGGNQESKPIDEIVRDLAALRERYDASEFLFFNAQSNTLAPSLARALVEARVDVRWSDSYRVRPSTAEDLETMVRGGCVSLTVGVESASDRVLTRMVNGHRAEHATRMIREADAHGILLRVNLLACFPGETRDEFEATRAWVHENAMFIDDLAPSSFYLTADSPIGRDPARFGVTIRGPRRLRGATKFRKSIESLAYDEVDGMTWEEREPTLAVSEDLLREAWSSGRGARASVPVLSPALMLSLGRTSASKAELYASLVSWRKSAEQRPAELVERPAPKRPAPRARPEASASAAAIARVDEALASAGPEVWQRLSNGSLLHAIAFEGGAILFKGAVRPVRINGHVAVRASLEEQVAVLDPSAAWASSLATGSELVALGDRVRMRRSAGSAIEERSIAYGRDLEIFSFVLGEETSA